MTNVTYIFTEKRKLNFENNSIEAKEFYYGLPLFDQDKYNVNVIEFENEKKLYSFILILLDEFLRRFVSLPFYSSKLFNIENIKTLLKTDQLIIIPESSGCSALLLLLLVKRFKKFKTHLFVMGLYSKKIKYKFFKPLHFLIIKTLVFNLDNVFFLGKKELEKANLIHKKKNKLKYFPFSVDTEFWKEETFDLLKNDKIIFVGNDGNRNTDLLIDIAKKLPDKKFLFVSQLPSLENLKLSNVEVISGRWGSEEIKDSNLKSIYAQSRLCIVPLNDTTQPSGQSVSLQCMSMGVPVIISRTAGFWDEDKFINNKHIIFAENNLNTWVNKINDVYEDVQLLEKISEQARKNVDKNFNLIKFYNKLLGFIKNG